MCSSDLEDTGGEASPPKKPTPSTPRGGGHRRTASGDVALARMLPMGSPKSPKLPRRKMERWSEGEIEPSSPQIEPQTPQTPFETPNFRLPALTGIKRVISTSTLMDIASYSTLAADRDADATHAPAEEPGTAYPHTRRLLGGRRRRLGLAARLVARDERREEVHVPVKLAHGALGNRAEAHQIGRASCRERV